MWVLGATGRTGRLIAQRLSAANVSLTLLGHDRARLERVAAAVGGAQEDWRAVTAD